MKTPIAYYGGKQAIISHILQLIPQHKVYTEVFFGGGTVFWAKDPVKNETINDRLDVVVNFYQVLKTDYKALWELIDQTIYSRTLHRKAKTLLHKNSKGSKVEKAWAFWVASNFSYMKNLDGGLAFSIINDVTQEMINKKKWFTKQLAARIEHTYIENDDAIPVLKSRDYKEAFHYLDPPYMGADQGHYKGYTENDFIDLLDCVRDLKGKFLLSNYNSEILTDYIKRYGWHKKEIVHRLKASRKSGSEKTEVLVWNYENNLQGKFDFK